MKEIARSKTQMNWLIFWMCAGFLLVFIAACLVNKEVTYAAVSTGFNVIGYYFGALIQVIMIVLLAIALFIACSKYGRIRIGGQEAKRELKNISWFAIVLTTMLAGGGVFFAAGEPFAHFMNLPAHFSNIPSAGPDAVTYALAQSYCDWGFLVWGASSFCITFLVYAKEVKHLPMRPSSMLYTVLGEKHMNGLAGKLFDGLALISVAAGTIGPTGFLGLQMAFALNMLWGIPNTVGLQMIIIMVAGVLFTMGAATGLNKGIDWLSKWTIYLSGVMIVGLMTFGVGMFMVDSFVDSFGIYLTQFFNMALSRTDTAWVNGWTVFYEAWFLGFGPSMGVLIINLSKGRTLREVILSVAVVCPLLTCLWFDLFGSTTMFVELANPGVVSSAYASTGMPAVLLTMLQNLSGQILLIPLALILILLYLVTTGAGVAYSMSVQVTNMEVPYVWTRILFSLLLASVAAVLVLIGQDNAVNTIQQFMVIGGMPVLIFFMMMIPKAKKCADLLYDDRFGSDEATDTIAIESEAVVERSERINPISEISVQEK